MKHILILFGMTLLCFGCQSDPQIDSELLNGEWIIDGAVRNGKETRTLDGLLFSFDEDELSTNLSGELESENFTIKGNSIICAEIDQTYAIINLDSSHLTLSTIYGGSEFQFTFNRDDEEQ